MATNDTIKAYGVYIATGDSETFKIKAKRKTICLTEDDAKWDVRILCAPYDAYDSGWASKETRDGKVYHKGNIELKIYYNPIELRVVG